MFSTFTTMFFTIVIITLVYNGIRHAMGCPAKHKLSGISAKGQFCIALGLTMYMFDDYQQNFYDVNFMSFVYLYIYCAVLIYGMIVEKNVHIKMNTSPSKDQDD